jgi:hypothetical protein
VFYFTFVVAMLLLVLVFEWCDNNIVRVLLYSNAINSNIYLKKNKLRVIPMLVCFLANSDAFMWYLKISLVLAR